AGAMLAPFLPSSGRADRPRRPPYRARVRSAIGRGRGAQSKSFDSRPVIQHVLLQALGGGRVADDGLQLDVLAVQPLKSHVVVAVGAVQDESGQEEAVLVQARDDAVGLADGVQI